MKTKRVSSSVKWNAADPTVMGDSINRKQKAFQSTQFTLQSENDHLKAQNRRTLTHMRRLCESIKTAPSHKERPRMGHGYCSEPEKVTPDNCNCEMEVVTDNQPGSESHVLPVRNEEAELQEMIEKLKDALSLQIKPGIRQFFYLEAAFSFLFFFTLFSVYICHLKYPKLLFA